MESCRICERSFKSINSVVKHVNAAHDGYDSKKYYDEFVREPTEGVCHCGAETTYRGAGSGYLKYCSPFCRSADSDVREKISQSHKGKKQTQEQIRKRIDHTDQNLKEEKRKKTCLERFGVDNPTKDSEIRRRASESNRGKSRPHRPGQAIKIAENRRRNGTNLHTQESKDRISEGIRTSEKFLAAKIRGAFIKGGPKSSGRSLGGYFKGLHFRSSLELAYLIEMHILGIEVKAAECSEFRCRYVDDSGKERWYYPDFYVPSSKTVIEIKPNWKLQNRDVQLKIAAARAIIDSQFEIKSESDLLNIAELVKRPEIKQHMEIVKNEHLCDGSKSRLGGKKSL